MTIPLPLLAVLGLIASAWTRINAVILGRPVSVPVIGILALAVVLTLTVAVLLLLRSVMRPGFRSSPHPRTATSRSVT